MPGNFQQMEACLNLDTKNYFGEGFQRLDGQIHVLIVVPHTSVRAATTATTSQPYFIVEVSPTKRLKIDASVPSRLKSVVALAEIGLQLLAESDLAVATLLKPVPFGAGIVSRSGLYIREEYWTLYTMIDKTLTTDKSLRRVLVVGSPGIGKSVFGVFLLLVFLMEKKDVAYHACGGVLTYFFNWNSENSYKITGTPLYTKTYVGLFDGNEAGGSMDADLFLHAFVFASPRTENYKHFVKDMCFTVYMNPRTKSECQCLADALDLKDQDKWLRRFNLVGGKPRLLFSSGDCDEMVLRVENAVPNTVDELKRLIRLFDDEERLKHIVFHMIRKENAPGAFFLVYSSLAAEIIVRSRVNIDEARSLFKIPANDLQSWRKNEIEKMMLQDLATRKLSVRPLELTKGSSALALLGPFNAKFKIIKASSEIKNELMLYIPLSGTFPAVDAVLVVPSQRLVIYAQSTVSKANPIKYQPFEDIYKNMTGRKTNMAERNEFLGYTHILLFIVSGDIYDDFIFQPYLNVDGETCKKKAEISVTQYVGTIMEP